MASQTTIERLYSQIERGRTRSVSGAYFIQQSTVREIFTSSNIDFAVAELACDVHERFGLAKKIQQEGIITFAILIWMRRVEHIVNFRNHECLDSKLPIHEARAQEIAPDFGLSFSQEYQWQFLPYYFKQDMCDHHRRIDDVGMIFPFIGKVEHIAEGGFGQVSKLTIPASLQDLFPHTGDTITVIRKKVKRRRSQSAAKYNEDFAREMAALRLLHRLRHPNIIPLLGSYTYNNEHNFLFPVFEMDLENFLNQDTRFGEFRWDFTFPLALCGLASALEHTHSLHLDMEKNELNFDAIGYHFDFRPVNILVNKSTCILADFGLGGFKPAEAGSETPWEIGAGDYIAPECMDSFFVNQRVGRAIDVWAFGCLLAEVVTYMELGPNGVRQFRASRLSEMRPGWQSTYFYNSDKQLKDSVHFWLKELGNTSSASTKQILQIAFEALEPDPHARPRIHQIRHSLSIHALRVLYSSVTEIFEKYMDTASTTNDEQHQTPTGMQLWFERERIRAYGEALHLDRENGLQIFSDAKKYEACCNALIGIFHKFRSKLNSSDTKSPSFHQVERLVDLREPFEEQIQGLVQNLWDILPRSYLRKVQTTWLQSMQTDDIHRLGGIDDFLQSHRQKDLADIGAMAHMRAIQMQMLNNPTTGAAEFLHPRTDLEQLDSINGHTYGLFKKEKQVLVEWMYYRPEWTNVPEEQRLVIMELRAKDFNTDPKPLGLRILKCVGFVEQTNEHGRKYGYGFLYELPPEIHGRELPVTLQQLLLESVDRKRAEQSQPPLRGKLQLAHALALFFEDFYTVGCLHETFNSRNVIFSHPIATILVSADILSEPYIVGFQKSRPDGKSWDTEGPLDDTYLHDYEHPDYREKRRFLLEYDYYSLGLVLLEIGLWHPLQVWSGRREYKALAPKGFRALLVEKYVPRLATTVGERYRNAVRICLDGTLERNSESSPTTDLDKEVFNLFVEKVVRPLEELSLLRI